MTISVTALFSPTQLGTSAATIYTAPASPSTTVLANARVRFTNTSGASRAITAYAVPAAGTAGAGNCFMNAETLAQNAHVDVDLPMLGPGAFFQALADAASDVTVTAISGVLFS